MSDQDLYVRRFEGHEPLGTIVYVHGLGESGRCFAALAEHPELRRWTHLVPDLVGYGGSPRAEPPPKLEEHAARLAAWLEAESGEPVVVLGHSMGGAIGTRLAQSIPERVQAFVNVEGNVSGDDCIFSRRPEPFSEEEWVEGGFDGLLEELERGAADDPVMASYRASVERSDPLTYYYNSLELVEMSEREDLAERLAKLGRPVLYVYGSPGGISARSRRLLRRAGVEPRPVAPAGHWPFLDQPDVFAALLGAFLDGLGPPR